MGVIDQSGVEPSPSNQTIESVSEGKRIFIQMHPRDEYSDNTTGTIQRYNDIMSSIEGVDFKNIAHKVSILRYFHNVI